MFAYYNTYGNIIKFYHSAAPRWEDARRGYTRHRSSMEVFKKDNIVADIMAVGYKLSEMDMLVKQPYFDDVIRTMNDWIDHVEHVIGTRRRIFGVDLNSVAGETEMNKLDEFLDEFSIAHFSCWNFRFIRIDDRSLAMGFRCKFLV